MKPTKEDLKARIINQLHWRGPTDNVALIWRGYLMALLEWGLIEVSVYDELKILLPPKGYRELHELILDEPIRADREKELDEYYATYKYSLPEEIREKP